MINVPSNWGTKDAFIPSTEIKEHVIVASPFIAKGEIAFKGSTEVTLENVDKEAIIYYRLGYKGGFKKYEKPFIIDTFINLSVYAEKNEVKSPVITTDFYKIDPNIKIDLKTDYANQYNAGGKNALIDGIIGAEDFRTGTWQGYFDKDLIAVVDLGKEKLIYNVKISFLKDQKSWIFLPKEVEIYTSLDGQNFQKVVNRNFKKPENSDEVKIESVAVSKLGKARYIKIIAKKLGKLPEWHLGYAHDGRSWLFVDEIQIK
ncbi:discoidin domain-containing protein [Polaribacter sp. KT25b]|uniref:discoidin domain-containing protein n=1 Tax=Polaribacter sp. KT25b TaxID=1855336 RepID=UPI0034A4FDFC